MKLYNLSTRIKDNLSLEEFNNVHYCISFILKKAMLKKSINYNKRAIFLIYILQGMSGKEIFEKLGFKSKSNYSRLISKTLQRIVRYSGAIPKINMAKIRKFGKLMGFDEMNSINPMDYLNIIDKLPTQILSNLSSINFNENDKLKFIAFWMCCETVNKIFKAT